MAWLDLPRRYQVPRVIDPGAGVFRVTRFRRCGLVGLLHLTKVRRGQRAPL
jgi:hypothetical protein